MAEISAARKNIQQEEAEYRAAVSEAFATKLGGSINFINDRQYDTHSFHLNGPIGLFTVAPGLDGIFSFLFDAEITGFHYYIGDAGSASSIIVDIHRLTGGDTDAGSIFSTRPEISSAASDGSYTLRDELNSTTLSNPTGHTLAVLSTTQVNVGDALRMDLDQRGTGFQNFNIAVMYRPR